mmetsp:Transcript_7228/g.45116  ORF Transcript_7228/g.45116 Transcript_7228/m.45116 type:complete len:130 (+) Transcript_7228:1304-1693(+)
MGRSNVEADGRWKQEEWDEASKKRMEGIGRKNKAKQRRSGWSKVEMRLEASGDTSHGSCYQPFAVLLFWLVHATKTRGVETTLEATRSPSPCPTDPLRHMDAPSSDPRRGRSLLSSRSSSLRGRRAWRT